MIEGIITIPCHHDDEIDLQAYNPKKDDIMIQGTQAVCYLVYKI